MKEIAKSLREVDSKFRALTSITQDEYNTIYSVFDGLMSSKILNYTLKGEKRVVKEYQERKNSSLQGTQSKLDFILLYLKENDEAMYYVVNNILIYKKNKNHLIHFLKQLEQYISLQKF
mgnify:CR=1 FL=1